MAQSGTVRYGVVEGWEQLPGGYEHRDVAGVAIDSADTRPDRIRKRRAVFFMCGQSSL
jgi:hypothetical protein